MIVGALYMPLVPYLGTLFFGVIALSFSDLKVVGEGDPRGNWVLSADVIGNVKELHAYTCTLIVPPNMCADAV